MEIPWRKSASALFLLSCISYRNSASRLDCLNIWMSSGIFVQNETKNFSFVWGMLSSFRIKIVSLKITFFYTFERVLRDRKMASFAELFDLKTSCMQQSHNRSNPMLKNFILYRKCLKNASCSFCMIKYLYHTILVVIPFLLHIISHKIIFFVKPVTQINGGNQNYKKKKKLLVEWNESLMYNLIFYTKKCKVTKI